MKAIRLELYQQTACYKKPFAFKVSETYPLPPYSTVKGMLHYLLDANTFVPMQLSIQGEYDTLTTDYQTHYFFKKASTNEFMLTADGLGVERNLQDITTMPIYMHMLYDVRLLIHIHAEEEIMQQIMERVNNGDTHLSLGRREDLVRIDRCEYVEVNQWKEEEEPDLTRSAYIPMDWFGGEQLPSHQVYNLNSVYRIAKGIRIWNKIKTAYVTSETGVSLDPETLEVIVDSYGDLVFFADITGEV